MYKEVKLEKGLYHIAGCSFSDMLEKMDPSEQYRDTPLAGLDAFERQLKRFDIHVSGPHCDRVEKFFSSTESAVLFPEFIRRAVYSGVERSILSNVTAVHTRIDASEYVAGDFADTAPYSTVTQPGSSLPISSYEESTTVLSLQKYGRAIHATYEAIRKQKLDAFAVSLRSVGLRLSKTMLGFAVTTMGKDAATTIDASTPGTLAYGDLTNLYGAFSTFDMAVILASPANAARILGLEQMREMASDNPSATMLPFGARLYKCGIPDDTVIGIDPHFALEMITSGDLLLETDKLIESQLDVITVSIRVAFRTIVKDAVAVLKVGKAAE